MRSKAMVIEAEILSEADFQRVSEMVYRHCGINLRDGKKLLVQARIAKRLRLGEFHSLSDYLDHVISDSGGHEFAMLIDAMSTNLTSFYREPDHFQYLAKTALPELAREKPNGGRLRLWSAGCATGEEPYTLAMTALDAIPDAGCWYIKILATDISTKVLGIAQAGFYGKTRVEALPAGYRQRFFQPRSLDGDEGFIVSPDVRQMIRFNHLNLVENWPFSGPFQFIFCRNVMIYFDKPTQQRLVNRFWDMLAPGGALFTGHSESLTGIEHKFQYIRPTIYGKN
jgi:chemotaxis protein methyltransferase CheR